MALAEEASVCEARSGPPWADVAGAGEALLSKAVCEAKAGPFRPDFRARLYAALYEQWCAEARVTVDVAELLSRGATEEKVGHVLGLTAKEVRDAVRKLGAVTRRLKRDGWD